MRYPVVYVSGVLRSSQLKKLFACEESSVVRKIKINSKVLQNMPKMTF